MTKAELEAHSRSYHARMYQSRAAENKGLYRAAVGFAISAWENIDGMMRFEGKYANREFSSIPAIDIVLKYAPLLLDFRLLNRLQELLETRKRIEKNITENISEKLNSARSRLWDCYRLWSHIERNAEVRLELLSKELGGQQDQWRSVIQAWAKMGLVRRTPQMQSCLISMSTRLGQIVSGKCPSCGQKEKAPKAMFLDKVTCPKCGCNALFVLLAEDSENGV